MEILFGKIYNPKFNFDKFGKGGSKSGENNPFYNKTHSYESKIKMSKNSNNTSGYFRVTKIKNNHCKQGFLWKYQYFEDGKQKRISSVSIDNLEKKVKDKGLEWRKL